MSCVSGRTVIALAFLVLLGRLRDIDQARRFLPQIRRSGDRLARLGERLPTRDRHRLDRRRSAAAARCRAARQRSADDLALGKKHYRAGNFGLAERYFRRAVETHPRDAEAWVGLAAAYDRLRRFDLADRAYEQAVAIIGPTPEVLNNRGYSYMLRGDYPRARITLLAAAAKDPKNPYIKNNLELLDKSFRSGKAVQ